MKNFKRIISFVMAMIIFASFFCYNTGATTIGYEFVGPTMLRYFSDTSAFAYVSITDWAEEENTTDLVAKTHANVEDYNDSNNFLDAIAYVELVVWLEDYSESRVGDIVWVGPDEPEFEAFVRGTECLNYDDHYSIVDFESSHKVELYFHIYDMDSKRYVEYTENDGPVIEIRTFD